MSLIKYIHAHSRVTPPGEPCDSDVVFFGVSKGPEATAEGLREAIRAHGEVGDFVTVNPLDGGEHNYLELGGWIGDQGLALTMIGLGAALGLWSLMTPKTMLGEASDEALTQQMAGAGYVGYVALPAKQEAT